MRGGNIVPPPTLMFPFCYTAFDWLCEKMTGCGAKSMSSLDSFLWCVFLFSLEVMFVLSVLALV